MATIQIARQRLPARTFYVDEHGAGASEKQDYLLPLVGRRVDLATDRMGRDMEEVTRAERHDVFSIRSGLQTNRPRCYIAVNLVVLVMMPAGNRPRIDPRANCLEILTLVCLNHLDVHVVLPDAMQVAFECCNKRDSLAFHVIARHDRKCIVRLHISM
jgi:hypothetical protein